MGLLLILFLNCISTAGTIFKKNYVNNTSDVKASLNIFMLLTHIIAAGYFFILAKGSVPLNVPTAIFSAMYAATCLSSVWFTMVGYNKTNLVYISVFSGAGSVIIPFILELCFSSQSFSISQILSVALRMLAILIPLFSGKRDKKGLTICIILFLICGVSGILPKMYAENPMVLSNSSFCFWTNIFIIPFVVILVLKKDGIKQLSSDMKKIGLINYAYIFSGTAISNISSLMLLYILTFVSATVYSVLSSSCGLILTALVSRLIYKEKLTKQILLSAAVSVLAIICGAF